LLEATASEHRVLEAVQQRVPDCRACYREGSTTKGTEPVTWYSQVMVIGQT